jgi:hypothetical protein
MHEHCIHIDKVIIMTSPTDPQTIVNQAAASLDQAATSLQAVAAALPALLAGSGTPVDTTALVSAVTAVITAANDVAALVPVTPPAGS